jgi:tetratricopeptide (TPR) repeat protein
MNILNVGTKILLKDVMDQYLRSDGDVRTYYGQRLSSALKALDEREYQLIFSEWKFPGGSVLDLVAALGGLVPSSNTYFVLAMEEVDQGLVALAGELGIDELLIRPFSTEHLSALKARAMAKAERRRGGQWEKMELARRAYRGKRTQESDNQYLEVLKEFRADPAVLLETGEYFLARGVPERALTIFEELDRVEPSKARVLHGLGRAQKQLGRFREAVQSLEKANSLSPDHSLRRSELASTYLSMAAEELVLALRRDGENGALILERAYLFLGRKDYAAAVSYLESKSSYFEEKERKEAESLLAAAKKLGGLR